LSSEESQPRLSADELRAAVEAAKAQYKAEKARYRKEREERKAARRVDKQPSGSASDGGNKATVGPSQSSPEAATRPLNRASTTLVSALPRLETDNHPRRYHTVGGVRGLTAADARSYARIMRKLGDMGFTESSHPSLPANVKSRLNNGITMTKPEEDDIITVIMEEMLVGPSGREGLSFEAAM